MPNQSNNSKLHSVHAYGFIIAMLMTTAYSRNSYDCSSSINLHVTLDNGYKKYMQHN